MVGSESIFSGFWMAGFEGADHCNGSGVGLDPNLANGHGAVFDQDYAQLRQMGIGVVRESIGWRLFAAAGEGGAERLRSKAQRASAHGLQVVWSLLHYGWPSSLDPLRRDDEFVQAFVGYCRQVCGLLLEVPGPPPVFQPINEISFLAWAATSTGLIHPHLPTTAEQGYVLKRTLVRATLKACDAIWALSPASRILHTDPLVHVAAPAGAGAELLAAAQAQSEEQFQAWDMLCGRAEPALGGAPRYLDIVGVNYYHSSQWLVGSNERLEWHLNDPLRQPFSQLAARIWARYRRPIVVAETGHVGKGRAAWLDHMAREVIACGQQGVPIAGVCLYPAVDRPDWENPEVWHQSGLWDVPRAATQDFTRVLDIPYAARLRFWQGMFAPRSTHSVHSQQGASMTHLIVFSHLRWDFVYQRPQQLLSRLAPAFPVIYVEEPVTGAAEPWLETSSPCDGVEVLRAHVTGQAQGFHDEHLAEVQALLRDYLHDRHVDRFLAWFYTPLALPFAAELVPRGVVYDCMDELAAFRFAPRQLVQRERALLKRADVVFTGGPSLFESKRVHHANVHCFPSSVDRAHFESATGDHPDQRDLGRPRLGYYGVIDERLDLELIAALAEARPDWQIVMVGPVVKIATSSLPQGPNLHWLGQRGYDELPAFLAGWDVCLLPFALNEATRFISPTKTLEYLAAGKPAVSTPIHDVVAGYAGIVAIADGAAAFIEACDQTLAMPAEALAERRKAARALLDATSWDTTAAQMQAVLRQLDLAPAVEHLREQSAAEEAVSAASLPAADRYYPVIVVGAGPTGLSAALELGDKCLLLEREATVGGWCRSIQDGGFTFDYAGHIMFSNDPYVLALYERLLGDNMHWQNREAWVYSKSVYTRYPFQGALHGLPPEVLKECIVGAIEARFGPLKKPALRVAGEGGPEAEPLPQHLNTEPPKNFEEFIYRVWGAGVARHFAIPYNRKLWAVPLDQMETSWLGGRVPMPDLEEMIDGALKPVGKPMGPNARFAYPLRGGFQAMVSGFLPLLECELECGAAVVSVSPSRKQIVLADGRRFAYDSLVSTMPLPKLVAAMGDEAPAEVQAAAAALRHVSVRCVNLGIAREAITDKHWIYYPEDTVFHRIFVQGNASPHCNAPGGFGLTCEITYSEYKALPADGEALIALCIADCVRVGIIRADDKVVVANQVDMPFAYVVYDHGRAAQVETVRQWCEQSGILLAGRYSEWEYYNSDHAFIAGRKVAERLHAMGYGLTESGSDAQVTAA